MKIAFVITGLEVGGAEMMLLKLIEGLSRDFDPLVISLSGRGELGGRIESLGIPLETVGLTPKLLNPIKLHRLVRMLKKFNPILLQSWMYHADLVGGIAAKASGVEKIVWGIRHNNLSTALNKYSTLAVVKLCANLSRWLPDKIICNSEVSCRRHVEWGYDEKKMIVIPNGFNTEIFYPASASRESIRRELGIASETPLIGLIARYDSQKNHLGFITAAELLHKISPSAEFVLAGKGVDYTNEPLVRRIKEAGLEKVTHLLGQRSDIPDLMASLDVLASPSRGEAFSNVIGEAMSCGVPCAVTDVGDSSFIVGDCGKVVPTGDMTALAHAISELLLLPPSERLSLAHRARMRIQEFFEIGLIRRKFEDLYRSL